MTNLGLIITVSFQLACSAFLFFYTNDLAIKWLATMSLSGFIVVMLSDYKMKESYYTLITNFLDYKKSVTDMLEGYQFSEDCKWCRSNLSTAKIYLNEFDYYSIETVKNGKKAEH